MTGPRRLSAWLDQVRADARMVFAGWRGKSPSPVLARRRGRQHDGHRRGASARAARLFRVAAVSRPTADSIAFELEDPTGASISFLPGQFFTLLVDVDGRQLRRAYSAASTCLDGSRVRLVSRRVTGGRVSNYLNDHLQSGQLIRALGPSGRFVCAPRPGAARQILLIAGGSGITPMMSIAQSLLEAEPDSQVALVYGNRDAQSIIFRSELDALAAAHGDRFTVRHVLSEPPADWQGGRGMLETRVLSQELDGLATGHGEGVEYFICGPEPMMVAARALLLERGVDAEKIHEERFNQQHARIDPDRSRAGSAQPARFQLAGSRYDISVAPGDTILDAGLAAGVPLRFSCAMGGCGACKLRLRQGAVACEEPNCLQPAEREAGLVLACVSRPTSPVSLEEA